MTLKIINARKITLGKISKLSRHCQPLNIFKVTSMPDWELDKIGMGNKSCNVQNSRTESVLMF